MGFKFRRSVQPKAQKSKPHEPHSTPRARGLGEHRVLFVTFLPRLPLSSHFTHQSPLPQGSEAHAHCPPGSGDGEAPAAGGSDRLGSGSGSALTSPRRRCRPLSSGSPTPPQAGAEEGGAPPPAPPRCPPWWSSCSSSWSRLRSSSSCAMAVAATST
jgi:hypothetical protein